MAKTVQGRGVVGMQPSMRQDVAFVAGAETLAKIESFLDEALTDATEVIYLLGCGGSNYMFGVMEYLLREAKIPVVSMNAAEFTAKVPAPTGSKACVIASSTHGTTRETAEAIKVAGSTGSSVALVTQVEDSLCGREAQHVLLHNGVEAKQVLLALVAKEILARTGASHDQIPSSSEFNRVAEVFESSNSEWAQTFEDFAKTIVSGDATIVIGAGPNIGAASTFAACYLMEMQNIPAVPVEANDFLHGTHELVGAEFPVLLLATEDDTEILNDRVKSFLSRFTDKAMVLDTSDLAMPGVAEEHRATMGAVLMSSSIIARLAQKIEAETQVPLITRKYMWKVEY